MIMSNNYYTVLNNSKFYNNICRIIWPILIFIKSTINKIFGLPIFVINNNHIINQRNRINKELLLNINNNLFKLFYESSKKYIIRTINYVFSNIYTVYGNTMFINTDTQLSYIICILIYINNITVISFGSSYITIKNLPQQVNDISINCNNNGCLDYLPKKILKLHITSCEFNNSVDDLPSTLTWLSFRNTCYFNYPMDHLPNSLTHLLFYDSCYNQPLNYLPNILFLKTNDRWNTSFENLPSSIIYMDISYYKTSLINIKMIFPKNIKYLILSHDYNNCGMNYNLITPSNFISLSDIPELIYLRFNNCIHSYILNSQQITANIKYIHFCDGFKFNPKQLCNPNSNILVPKCTSNVLCSKIQCMTFKREFDFNFSMLDNFGNFIKKYLRRNFKSDKLDYFDDYILDVYADSSCDL